MVTPAPSDLKVARRIAFLLKTAGFGQRDGSNVAGLNVGLKAVKFECLKGVANNCI